MTASEWKERLEAIGRAVHANDPQALDLLCEQLAGVDQITAVRAHGVEITTGDRQQTDRGE